MEIVHKVFHRCGKYLFKTCLDILKILDAPTEDFHSRVIFAYLQGLTGAF